MARWGQPDRCVFCGLPIGPDEPAVGHGESAAHAACADVALGDERLWDGIAGAVGGDGPVPGGDDPVPGGDDPVPADDGPVSPSAGRAGCALVGVLLLATAAAAWRVRH